MGVEMLQVTLDINGHSIGQINIRLRSINSRNVGTYISELHADTKEPPIPSQCVCVTHKREQGAFELIKACLSQHLIEGNDLNAANAEERDFLMQKPNFDQEEIQDEFSCGACKGINVMHCEYSYDHPNHYDGVSEIHCADCGVRTGRWSRRILAKGESEPRFGQE
jgi:hypothetical protein